MDDKTELERLRAACSRENEEICQVLGRALGYPRFADDQANFPGATDADGVCVGDHVAASLAAEAADEIGRLRSAAPGRETIESIARWADETFGPCPPNSPARCLRLLEEVVELCYAAGADGQAIVARASAALRNSFVKWAATGVPEGEKEEEIADCYIVWATIAHGWGVGLGAVDRKMAVNRHERKWSTAGDGTGQHVA